MSSFIPDYFLSESENFLDKTYDDFRVTFNDTYSEIAKNVNTKELGYYQPTEMVNGQRWYDTPQNYKTVYRKRVDVGALLDTANKPAAHDITITASTIVTRIYGTANYASNEFLPLPYMGANPIYLSMDGSYVNVQSTSNRTNYTAYVIIEYVQG